MVMVSSSVASLMLLGICVSTSKTDAFTFSPSQIRSPIILKSPVYTPASSVFYPYDGTKAIHSSNSDDNAQSTDDFWRSQKELAQSMNDEFESTSKRYVCFDNIMLFQFSIIR